MRHEILEEVWRIRDQIFAECGHDLKEFAAMLRRNETTYGDRLTRLPIRRKPKSRVRLRKRASTR